MEMLKNKRKRLQIFDLKGYVMKNSPFIIVALTKDYKVIIHED